MNSSACLWRRGFLSMVCASAAAALLSAPAAEAQMIGDVFRSPLTSSLLQTSQQRDRRRLHRSSDPYIALIEQSSPDAYLRRLQASSDPYSAATSAAALTAPTPSPRAGMRMGVSGDPLGIGQVAAEAGVPAGVMPTASGFKVGAPNAAALGRSMSVVPGAGRLGMPGMAVGVSGAGCSGSLAGIGVAGGGCR
ncbi:hypothetical protein [Paraburkholderia kururiensis]|uniref:hypothetical protein n=1 Tax=Paraburkholderia kururiensis TaxID=984307 RepID=UPI000F88F83A|nr:hypothetical protein [Paraburkholderia kururiensis]